MIKRLLLLLVNLLILAGCSEKNDPKPLTYSQLLTGTEKKAWKMTLVERIDEGRTLSASALDFFEVECFADDLYVFYANEEKLMEVTEGLTKCRSSDPDVYFESSWSLVNSTATLDFPIPIIFGGQSVPFVLKELTAKRMVVEYYYSDIDLSERYTFEAQSDK